MDDLAGKRVTVMGLGRFGGGVGVTRWLVDQRARVTVSDQAGADTLAESVEQLGGLDVELHLGGHDRSDFVEAELLVVNPAVPKDSPFLQLAKDAAVPVTSEMNLFFQRCRGRMVGVTGTAGKSTTTAMIAAALGASIGEARVWVGGNIGKSLLADLEAIGPDDLVVLELSSFQLEDLGVLGRSPWMAVITSLFANHLDRHKTMAAYVEAKLNIARYQNLAHDHLLIPAADSALAEAVAKVRGDLAGVWRYYAGGAGEVGMERDGERVALPAVTLAVPGPHNRANAAAALGVARLCGADVGRAAKRLASFGGLPHRLELVCCRHDVRYYDDSKSTTPEATITALEALGDPLIVLVGGHDKGVGFEQLGRALADGAKAVVCYGQTGRTIAAAVGKAAGARGGPQLIEAESFEAAVATAGELAEAGDVVLLSPGCASYDMFVNYEQRGRRFRDIVESWG